MNTAMRVLFFFGMTLILLLPYPASAEWPADPSINVPVCLAPGGQDSPVIVSDGEGGAVLAWLDGRPDNAGIFAQRIAADGTVLWATDGVAICTNMYFTGDPKITSDGAGGAIVIWQDFRSGDFAVYAQRITSYGAVQWTPNGVALSSSAESQVDPAITSDGAGGAIATWFDGRNGNWDIFAQKITAEGVVQWTAEGAAICTSPGGQSNCTITSDNTGGSIIAWVDYRDTANGDIYSQRVSANGSKMWAADGVALCSAPGNQLLPMTIPDGNSGGIVTWYDPRGGDNDIYAQKVSHDGIPQWKIDGVVLCAAAGDQDHPKIISNTAGGAIATWYDYRNGEFPDIYAQQVSDDGSVQWLNDGVAICLANGYQIEPYIAEDGEGGGIITWYDNRSGINDIFAQRISATGVVQWTDNGIEVCSADDRQIFPTIAPSGTGMAIVTWQDGRGIGVGPDHIYAQRVPLNSELSGVIVASSLFLECYPNPFNPLINIRFEIQGYGPVRIEVYDIRGRRIAELTDQQYHVGEHSVEWRGRDSSGRAAPSGEYFFRVEMDGQVETRKAMLLR